MPGKKTFKTPAEPTQYLVNPLNVLETHLNVRETNPNEKPFIIKRFQRKFKKDFLRILIISSFITYKKHTNLWISVSIKSIIIHQQITSEQIQPQDIKTDHDDGCVIVPVLTR